MGHEAVAFADIDNDGDLDALTKRAQRAPVWHVNSDKIMGTLWRNDGKFQFADITDQAGLSSLKLDISPQWATFWDELSSDRDCDLPNTLQEPTCTASEYQPRRAAAVADEQLYPGMSVFADFNNDGWLDLLVTIREDTAQGKVRNILFMNKGDGTFSSFRRG